MFKLGDNMYDYSVHLYGIHAHGIQVVLKLLVIKLPLISITIEHSPSVQIVIFRMIRKIVILYDL